MTRRRLKSHNSLWRVVRGINAEGRLALFVGAGVSMGCGLPSWDTLVERVLVEVWRQQPHFALHLIRQRHLLATRYARQKIGNHFNEIVHECLYRDQVTLSPCVRAIARSGIKKICTFNFDDLIEEALQTEGKRSTGFGSALISKHDDIYVYHPHGILPRFYQNTEIESSHIVFSEDDYHGLYSDPYSWANVIQLHLLTVYSVLFIGLSMQDPNLRRLIDIARTRGMRNQHFAVFRDPTKGVSGEESNEQKLVRQMIEMDMKSLAVTPWFVDSYDKLGEILEAIAPRGAHRLRPVDAL